MYNKINYTLVGIFVFLFGIGLFAFGFWLSKYDTHSEYKLYKIYFSENVSGLSKDSSVKLRGVDVGKVVSISIDPKNIEKVEVVVKIKKDVPIKEDMRAHLEMIGVTGLLSIVIDGGSNAAKDLVAKSQDLPIIKTKLSWFDSAKDSVASASKKLNILLKKSEKVFSDSNIENLSNILVNLNNITKNATKIEENTLQTLNQAKDVLNSYKNLANVSKVKVEKLSKNFDTITKDFNTLTKSLKPTIKSITRSSNRINRVAIKIEKGLNRGDYNLRDIFEPLTIDTRLLTNQISSLVRQITKSPNDIIFKSRKNIKGPGE